MSRLDQTRDSPGMEVVEVRSLDQLAAVARIRPVRQFMSAKRLLLRLPSLQRPLQESTERRLNFWLGVCGCQAGALFLLAALGCQIADPSLAAKDSLFEAVLRGAGLSVAAGVLGKAAAILFARAMFIAEAAWFFWRIRREAREGQVLT